MPPDHACDRPAGASPAGAAPTEDERLLRSLGYAQELFRRMSGFSNFAISFSMMCILASGITSLQLGLRRHSRSFRFLNRIEATEQEITEETDNGSWIASKRHKARKQRLLDLRRSSPNGRQRAAA